MKRRLFPKRRPIKPLERFELRVVLLIVCTAVATVACVFIVVAVQSHNVTLNAMRSQSEIIADYALGVLNPAAFDRIDGPDDHDSYLYRNENGRMNRICQVGGLKYLYTVKRAADGTLVYTVDGQPPGTPDFCPAGLPVEEGLLEDIERAMAGQDTLAGGVRDTGYGPVFTSYWPVENEDGGIVGVLGLEYDAENLTSLDEHALLVSFAITVGVILVMCMLFTALYKRVSIPFHQKLAYLDILTELQNRTAFELDLQTAEAEGRHKTAAMAIFDLNNLKHVNDSYGHNWGDEYLRGAAGVIHDIFAGCGTAYRIGGDEFALVAFDTEEHLLLERLTGPFATAVAAARAKVHQQFPGGPFEIAWGFAAFDRDCHDGLHDLYRDADADMYRMKREMKANLVASDESTTV